MTAYTPFAYAGYYTDPTGLAYNVARYYDPATGQFMAVDPLVNSTQQPYEYANDNPVSEVDPSGLCGSLSSWGSFWANCGSDVVNAGTAAASAVGGGVSSGATWVANHPGQAAEGLAGGVCIVASDGLCAGAIGVAFGASTYVNTQNPGFWGHEAVTAGETLLLGGAGLIKTGLGAAGGFETTLADGTTVSTLPESFLGNAGVNAAVTWPALVGIGLEGPIDQAIFCGG